MSSRASRAARGRRSSDLPAAATVDPAPTTTTPTDSDADASDSSPEPSPHGDGLSCSLSYEVESGGVPVFRPQWSDFRDFAKFIETIDVRLHTTAHNRHACPDRGRATL